ncbi:uncharacterized protein [Mytilus edulis]|uniref:uncharacterized protein n=1 Tax=Mytilus edulis TaxID=6550 RepID=UPI0039EFB45E
MKQVWNVFVFFWFIFGIHKLLLTKAGKTYTNFTCGDSNITIHTIAIEDLQLKTSCISPTCDLMRQDLDNEIKRICTGSKGCLPDNNVHTSCVLSHVYISVSYICISNGNNEKKYDFEEEITEDWKIDYMKTPWIRYEATNYDNIIRPTMDHSSARGNGHYLSIESGSSLPYEMEGKLTYKMAGRNVKCLIFWYYMMNGNNIKSLIVKLKRNNQSKEEHQVDLINEGRWIKKSIDIMNSANIEKIDLETTLNGSKSCVAVDDIIISNNPCSEIVHEYECLEMNGKHTMECPALYPYFSEIEVKIDPQVNTSDEQCKETEDQLANFVNELCTFDNRITNTCTFSLDSISEIKKSCLLHRNVHLNYSCTDMSSNSSAEIATVTNNIDTSIFISTKVQSTEKTGTSMFVTTEKQYISTFQHTDVISPSNLSSSSSVIGIVIGVILPIVVLAVCLVIAVVYVRRSRYSEKNANSIVVEKKNHSDYTGHQNVAFSPEVNVTTQTDYCEIRTSKHNDQYHDISDTFRPLINTTTDDEYSEIANVVNSPNNPNACTNYQHQYISLDPNATGFDRSIPQNNLQNEIKNNHINSNEITSFTGGDDYAILDPDDLNESKNNTPKVLPLSNNYVVLDPNETGFNRQKNTDGVCNYELATPINPTETSEDPYDVSKDETYDTSSNSRHKEKENNIYSHTVDNVYDTAGNQRKKEESDATYDHFFGQQSEDDYDISKPL